MTVKSTRPAKLGAKARRLWGQVTDTYQLRGDELRILEDACREVDLIEIMQGELADCDVVTYGSKGQPVAHPLVAEIRQHRATLARLLAALKLTDADEEAAGNSRSASARDAATSRWRRAS